MEHELRRSQVICGSGEKSCKSSVNTLRHTNNFQAQIRKPLLF
jgi:hypothetical protein